MLLAVSTVATAALAVLPESFNRPMAVPEGVALIGLGISLWRDQRNVAPRPPVAEPSQSERPVSRPDDRPATAADRRSVTGTGHVAGRSRPALVALSAIPLAAGALRLVQLAGGPAVMPADHRFTGFPGRPGRPHRRCRRLRARRCVPVRAPAPAPPRAGTDGPGGSLAVAGLMVAVSALWLTLFYEPQPGTGDLLSCSAWSSPRRWPACLVLGFNAIRRRDIAAHRAWMTRAYALGLGAGTQAFTEGIGEAVFGTATCVGDLAKGAAWVINLAVAEWVIRRPAMLADAALARRSSRRTPVTT